MGPRNAVFVSYRRDASELLTVAIYQHLTAAGIDVFYDIESIRAGKFRETVLNQIRSRPYFILVLTPQTLERCGEEGDWLRLEIETAIAADRIIVPVYNLFDWRRVGEMLPDGLGHTLATYQALEVPPRYFNYAMQELVEEYLLPVKIKETSDPPPEDQAEVKRFREAAAATAEVTDEQLITQEKEQRKRLGAEYFLEQAYDWEFPSAPPDYAYQIKQFSIAIDLEPNLTEAFHRRGRAFLALARQQTRDDEGRSNRDSAIADFDEAIRLNPNIASAFFDRGYARMGNFDLDGAIGDYSEAIRLDRRFRAAYSQRSIALWNSGHRLRAVVDWWRKRSTAYWLMVILAIAFVVIAVSTRSGGVLRWVFFIIAYVLGYNVVTKWRQADAALRAKVSSY